MSNFYAGFHIARGIEIRHTGGACLNTGGACLGDRPGGRDIGTTLAVADTGGGGGANPAYAPPN